MYIKRYTIAALILIVLVGGYVYSYVTQDSTTLDFFGIPLPSLSIAIWVIVPLLILYLASVFHMAFYSMLGGLKIRKYEKDYDKVLDLIVDAYLGKKDRKHEFKTSPYSLLGRLLDNSTIFPNGEIEFQFDSEKTQKMTAVLNVINDIRAGKVADLKPYNLDAENELVLQNDRNKYKNGELSCEDILSHSTKYAKKLVEEVYVDYVKNASANMIDKYKEFLTKDAFHVILARINAEENTLEMSNEALLNLISNLEFDRDGFIELSQISAENMIPEQRIKLFEMLSLDNEDAMDAYLYTLYDLEMVEPANDILDISQPEEYQNFKAYRALKECNKHFCIKLFI
jgi:hypothetical protein